MRMPGKHGPVPVIGVPSASARPSTRKPGAGYALFEISGQPGARSVTFVRRGLSPDYTPGGKIEFVELSRRKLSDAGA